MWIAYLCIWDKILIMFKDLLIFEKKRNTKEAIGFYLAYFFASILFVVILGYVILSDGGYSAGLEFGQKAVVFLSVILACLILYKKNIIKKFKSIVLILLVGVCAIIAGALLSMILIAYLTTLDMEWGN